MFLESDVLDTLLRAVVLSTLAVFWVIVIVRIVGLRAFSKMTAFDFVVTIASGSLLAGASQATDWSGFVQATLAIGTLLSVQLLIARLRKSSDAFEAVVQNNPVLLMRDGVFLQASLEATRVVEDDIVAKLREANVLDFEDVRAVILETTGDISVLHGDKLSDSLLKNMSQSDQPPQP